MGRGSRTTKWLYRSDKIPLGWATLLDLHMRAEPWPRAEPRLVTSKGIGHRE